MKKHEVLLRRKVGPSRKVLLLFSPKRVNQSNKGKSLPQIDPLYNSRCREAVKCGLLLHTGPGTKMQQEPKVHGTMTMTFEDRLLKKRNMLFVDEYKR